MLVAAKALVVALGVCFSVFYGRYATDILVDTDHEYIKRKSQLRCWRFHERWLNFMGCGVGWAAVYYLLFVRMAPGYSRPSGVEDIVLIVIALLGIAGFLPATLSQMKGFRG